MFGMSVFKRTARAAPRPSKSIGEPPWTALAGLQPERTEKLLQESLQLNAIKYQYNFTFYFIYVQNSISRSEHRMQIKGALKHMLRITFEPKKEKTTQKWRNFHNEELHEFYLSPNILLR
jgi:hypothetical protein